MGMMGHPFALESPGLSLVCPTSSRDPWWLQGKSSYQWSTASAKGREAHSGLGLRAQGDSERRNVHYSHMRKWHQHPQRKARPPGMCPCPLGGL